MIYYGKGGWTWDDLYNHIPVFLRNFYLKEMTDAVEREAEATKGHTGKESIRKIPDAVRKSIVNDASKQK